VAEDPTARVPIAEARYPRRVLLRLRTLSAPEGRAISSGALRVVRIARSRLLRQVLAPFVLLQALCVWGWWMSAGEPFAYVRFAFGMGAASALALVGCFAGGQLERRLALFSRLARTREARRSYYERLEHPGDVTLERWVAGSRPQRAVADLSATGLTPEWRRETRAAITSLYEGPWVEADGALGTRRLQAETVRNGITRTLVTFAGPDGIRIPAYLFSPPGSGRRPAALVIPGHGRGIVETAGRVPSYQHGAALELADAGYVTLTMELRGFGHLGEVIGTDHAYVASRALLAGSSYPAIVLGDLRRALSVLAALPAVDAERIAVTGCSLGGDLAVTLGALDSRVAAVVAQGVTRWSGPRGHRPSPEDDGSRFTRDPCGIIPGEMSTVHYEDRFLLIAPRPFAVIGGWDDVGHFSEADSWLVTLLRDVYRLEGVPEQFGFIRVDGGHEYHLAPAIEFLNCHLGAQATRIRARLWPGNALQMNPR